MNEKRKSEAAGDLLLIFRRHLPWIHWALWHATLRSVAPSGLQTLTTASLPPTVRGDIADVPQAGEEGNMPPVLFTMTHPLRKSCLSLWTCSVLFQLMSTAGPLARCSEFNEWNDLAGIFSSFFFFLSFFLIFAQHKIGQRALDGNCWLNLRIFFFFLITQGQKCNIWSD